jgi:mRNA-degrading endonuclease RelE of RelBE toxin-antitoxin system
MPNGAGVYGIVQMPDVRKALESDPAHQIRLMKAIFALQDDPRPPRSERADEYGLGFNSLVSDDEHPPYGIVYRVDDDTKKVVVIAVYEKRWSS